MAPAPRARYRFGVFNVDPQTAELRKQGVQVRLRGRPFELLTLLLERAGEVVTREELRERLWSADTFVDFDHGLNTSVNKLREVLGDSAANPRFIETIPRRGYRFIAPVATTVLAPPEGQAAQALEPAATVAGAPRAEEGPGQSREDKAGARSETHRIRMPLVFAGVLALVAGIAVAGWLQWRDRHPGRTTPAAPTRLMLAVLPFRNLDGTPGDFFSDGVTEEMIAQLGALEPQRLGVIARTTVMQYRQSSRSLAEIGRDLDVDYVLEGSVRRSDGRVRVTAQLVQVSDQTQLWAETYESPLEDVLQAQQAAASRIARSLALRILPASGGSARPMPASFAALEAYLRGRHFREQATVDSVHRGIEYFQRATELDPNYALAWAGLGDGYRLLAAPGWEDEPPRVLLTKAKGAVERALALAPDLPEGLAAQALIRFTMDWDLAMAERDLQHAIALNPSYAQAHQYYSSVLTAWGRFDEAIDAARRARELDPLSLTANATLGIRYYYAGRYPEALAQFDATNELDPGFGVTQWGLAVTRRELGDREGSVRDMRRAAEQSRGSYMTAWLGHALAVAGRTEEARAVLAALEQEAGTRYVSPFHFALVTLGLGDRDATLTWLERARADGSGWIPFLGVEPEFAALRSQPRFQALLASSSRP